MKKKNISLLYLFRYGRSELAVSLVQDDAKEQEPSGMSV